MNQWATMDTVLPEKDLHVQGTRLRGGGTMDFWMFNPPLVKPCRVRCGMCKRGMDGYRSCPHCYPDKQEE
jgi:hypothetical protein|tara:strand:+ start:2303 stop:2512 length:210 start_codon:yes stop_codon:yes gene_type:complete